MLPTPRIDTRATALANAPSPLGDPEAQRRASRLDPLLSQVKGLRAGTEPDRAAIWPGRPGSDRGVGRPPRRWRPRRVRSHPAPRVADDKVRAGPEGPGRHRGRSARPGGRARLRPRGTATGQPVVRPPSRHDDAAGCSCRHHGAPRAGRRAHQQRLREASPPAPRRDDPPEPSWVGPRRHDPCRTLGRADRPTGSMRTEAAAGGPTSLRSIIDPDLGLPSRFFAQPRPTADHQNESSRHLLR